MAKLSIGDDVFYKIPGPSPSSGYGTVIGFHPLSQDDSLPVLAGERSVGMPINAAHCAKVGESYEAARRYRERYLAMFAAGLRNESEAGRLALAQEPKP